MTIAYCVVAHQRPAQTQRLVHRLLADDPACQVVLHYDQRYEPLDLSKVTLPRVRLVRERPLNWGTPAIVDLFVEMLQIALAAGCSYASILSGQDYPVRAVGGLETVLSQYDVWADLRPLLTEDGSFNGDAERARYTYRWWYLNTPPRWLRGIDRGVAKALGDPSYRTQPPRRLVRLRQRQQIWWGVKSGGPGVPIYEGSVWMDLSARAIEAVCASSGNVRSFFRHVPCADEACLHTILGNTTGLSFAPGNGRFIRWAPGAESPDILTLGDLTDIRSSGAHFARKFDERVDAAVLDHLDPGGEGP
jgi:hypothetical protein